MLGNADTRVVEDMCRATAVGVTNHVGLLRRLRLRRSPLVILIFRFLHLRLAAGGSFCHSAFACVLSRHSENQSAERTLGSGIFAVSSSWRRRGAG